MTLHRDAIIEAHKIRKTMRRLGDDWSWSRCMRYGWNKAKGRQALGRPVVLKEIVNTPVHDHAVKGRHLLHRFIVRAGRDLQDALPQQHKGGACDLPPVIVMEIIEPLDQRDQVLMRSGQRADEIGFVVKRCWNTHSPSRLCKNLIAAGG